MGESIESLMRRGMVSEKQGGKFGKKAKPSKAKKKSATPNADEIDQSATQRPAFPKGSKPSAKNDKRQVGVKGGVGKSSGDAYGGPNSRKGG